MKNIRHIMQEHGITQKILAENSGINQSTLSKLLSGKASFTLEHIAKIARALNIDAADLVSFRPGTVITNTCFSSHYIPENDNLVCSINRPAFKGYIGIKYYLCFYSTISLEAKWSRRTHTFRTDENRCRVNLETIQEKSMYPALLSGKYIQEIWLSRSLWVPVTALWLMLRLVNYVFFHFTICFYSPRIFCAGSVPYWQLPAAATGGQLFTGWLSVNMNLIWTRTVKICTF